MAGTTMMTMMPSISSDSDEMIDYRLNRLLGKGGFSSCYEAFNSATSELVAMKVIEKSGCKKSDIENEINIQKGLNHENILKFVHSFEDSRRYYILTALCQKQTIQVHYRRCGPFSAKTCRYYSFQCLRALAYLGSMGIIHRDIKPSNVFLDEAFNVKLGDFGLAVRVQDVADYKSKSGTIGFAAPEVFSDGKIGPEGDVWSYGCTVYAIFRGVAPFRTVEETSTADPRLAEGFEPAVAALVRFVLRREPGDRPHPDQIEQHEYFKSSPVVKPTLTELNSKFAPLRLRTVDRMTENRNLAENLRRLLQQEGQKS